MITYWATTPHGYTFEKFVNGWAPELADRSQVVGWSTADLDAAPAPGLHVLTDFERLSPGELRLASRVHRALVARPGTRVLGNPATWLDRHALLRRLYEEGINDFRAYRVHELGVRLRFPVFLRWANAHDGSLGDPVPDRRTLEARLDEVVRSLGPRWRRVRQELLVVEKVDAVSPDRLFRKYSVARIGDAYVPRHVEVSGSWVTKFPSVVNPDVVAAEEAFLEAPRDLPLVREVFRIAGVEFGRVDWGYASGRAQFWEINTNPMLAPGGVPHELRAPSQRRQTALTREALEAHVPSGAGTDAPLLGAAERPGARRAQAAGRRRDADRR